MKKADMEVYGELLDSGEVKLELRGMNFRDKLKVIKMVLLKNKLKVYLTSTTVKDLKDLLNKRAL